MQPPDRNRTVVCRDKEFPLGGTGPGKIRGIRSVCPVCGELWGKLELPIGLGGSARYHISVWPCDKHGDAHTLGGGFLTYIEWWPDLFFPTITGGKIRESLSYEFLRHEVEMKINQVLRY